MHNAYHLLFVKPAIMREHMPPALEMLAEQLVHSGRLRIHTDSARNFITYSGPGYDYTFSRREMTDPRLIPHARQLIALTVPGGAGAQGIEDVFQRLLMQFRRTGEIEYEKELQVARLLVQATHPAVLMLSLYEGVSYFVSYSHNVADLMAIHFWEHMEGSGGLQSVSGDGAAVYVSCGGDPFIEKEEHKTYVSDGFSALARFMVIAAQECGHYADILRDREGRAGGRHSAWVYPLMPRDNIKSARDNDIITVRHYQHQLQQMGIIKIAEKEKQRDFLEEHRKYSIRTVYLRAQIRCQKRRLLAHAQKRALNLILHFPSHLVGSRGWATDMVDSIRDMEFNLTPAGDAYRRADPHEEEAIACIEALARVPQQVMKWGHEVTRLCWPNLYAVYYQQVIPHCIASYEAISGKKFYMPDIKPRKPGGLRRLIRRA
jgi:hypothetical protein